MTHDEESFEDFRRSFHINAVFPIDVVGDLAADGVVGGVAATHDGFVGAASRLQLRNEVAPRWADELRADEVDVCLLVAT
ncbi:MAG: hypothetical protein KY462_09965 [Actinobacteria bacterium]|nr:hypothetical protein [Actinomycetota bacterium]